MIRGLRLGAAALVLLCVAYGGWAQDIPKGVLQAPDMEFGWNLQSQWDAIDGEPNIIRADNWRCPDGRPVTDIHWWGSYYFNTGASNPVQTFEVSIYADNNPSGNLPGTLLYRETFDSASLNETSVGFDTQGEEVFQYTAYLKDSFEQTAGEVYWLSIVALTEASERWPMWGWHTASAEDLNDDELLGSAQSTKDPTLIDGSHGGNVANPWQDAEYEMAFELTTIPEPSIVALVGLGMFALWTRFRRR